MVHAIFEAKEAKMTNLDLVVLYVISYIVILGYKFLKQLKIKLRSTHDEDSKVLKAEEISFIWYQILVFLPSCVVFGMLSLFFIVKIFTFLGGNL